MKTIKEKMNTIQEFIDWREKNKKLNEVLDHYGSDGNPYLLTTKECLWENQKQFATALLLKTGLLLLDENNAHVLFIEFKKKNGGRYEACCEIVDGQLMLYIGYSSGGAVWFKILAQVHVFPNIPGANPVTVDVFQTILENSKKSIRESFNGSEAIDLK